jgi:hypothetical protein
MEDDSWRDSMKMCSEGVWALKRMASIAVLGPPRELPYDDQTGALARLA